MQNISYRIERMSPENIHLLQLLYLQVFKKKVSVHFFKKKYSTKNFGAEFIGYFAITDKNFPAAFYGVIPSIMQIGSADILTAQSADTMTHKRYRNQGLFRRLALKTYELARENNIKFIFGFPNENSFPGLVKLGWEFSPEPLKRFTIQAARIPYAKVFFKTKILSTIHSQISKFILAQDSVRQTIFPVSDSNCCVKHDYRFMKYKEYSQSFYTRLDQIDLWIKTGSSMKIGFVQFHENTDGNEFRKRIKRLALILGCISVSFITHKHSALYNTLCDTIQPEDSFPIGFYNLTKENFQFAKIGFEYCDIDIF